MGAEAKGSNRPSPKPSERVGSGWRDAGRAATKFLFSLPQRVLIGVVNAYRLLLKPWVGNACRFEPSCSAYTLQALRCHGASGGVLLGGWRLLRCHPWCAGGCDPVPDHHPLRGVFTRFTSSAVPDVVHANANADTDASADKGTPEARPGAALAKVSFPRIPSSSRSISP